jgi:phosphopantetheine adenylyltransferase
LVSEPVTDLRDSNQSKIQRWRTKNGVRVLNILMVLTTRCGKGGWPLSSAARIKSCGMSQ